MTARYHMLLFQGSKGHKSILSLNRSCCVTMQDKLDKVIDTPKEETEIDIWLDSPGGDAHATYKLWLDLRARANKLRVIVPDFAKSAATLLTLGADEIYLAPGADMGPLDVQIPHPDREERTISALDAVGSLDYLSKFAIEFAITGGASIVHYSGLSRIDVLREMLKFTANLLEPVVAKIDPTLTRQAHYQLEVAERYAVQMLLNRNVSNGLQMSRGKAQQIAKALVNDYPVHGFVISMDDAVEMGLPVRFISEYTHYREVMQAHDKFLTNDESVALVVKQPEIKKKKKAKTKKLTTTASKDNQ